MARRANLALVSLGLFLLLSCGGTVVVSDDDGGAGDGGSGGGTAGTGGDVAGTGGGVAGTGGGVAGTGGGVAGTGGGVAGSGGVSGTGGGPAGSGGGTCQPLPDCNWCGGATVYGADGCPVGYVCDNGADPCSTGPCYGPYDCMPNQKCVDMLCWSAGPVSCYGGTCSVGAGGNAQSCDCEWKCDDGNAYRFNCTTIGSSGSCECYKNGYDSGGCGMAGGSGGGPSLDACSIGDCCGFPQ